MNTRFFSLFVPANLILLGAFALPAFAQQGNLDAYGAGFYPSPVNAYSPAPAYVYAPPSEPVPALSTANYGAGFYGSPTIVRQYGENGVRSTTNYGAGFYGSPTILYSNRGARAGFYGAGFMPSPVPIYSYGFGLGIFRW